MNKVCLLAWVLPPFKRKQVGGAASAMHCGSFLTLSQRDHENTLSAFFQARMNQFQFIFHIYNTLNYLIHKTFIFPPVNYPFKVSEDNQRCKKLKDRE